AHRVVDRGGSLTDADARSRGAGQGHGDAIDARLAAVLNAVAVDIRPYEVANLAQLVETEVDGLVAAAAGQRGGAGAGVAVGGRCALTGGGRRVTRWRGHGDRIGARGEVSDLVVAGGASHRVVDRGGG